ncbi:hypothetical protein Zmor_008887 [Zophobas morio]|uniref:Uncharacterized protein n=1 Tax=Zophobas morio TaxID=2755281 RepID=A0AA38HJ76_9CUCU|nr:hypothetical protein Zmor_008887 [Zophobas morio]
MPVATSSVTSRLSPFSNSRGSSRRSTPSSQDRIDDYLAASGNCFKTRLVMPSGLGTFCFGSNLINDLIPSVVDSFRKSVVSDGIRASVVDGKKLDGKHWAAR